MKENPYPGVLIVFEGVDGSGKTTQAARLKRWLEQANDRVLYTKEPTYGDPFGQKLRRAIAGEIEVNPLTLQKWFIADRDHHLHYDIIPELGKGETIICDRYFLSTLAYGSLGGENVVDRLVRMHLQIPHFILPDLTLIIDVDAKTAVERQEAVQSGDLDIFEKEATLAKVRTAYHVLARRFDNVFTINGERNEEEIFEDVKRYVRHVMERRRAFLFPQGSEKTEATPRIVKS